MVAKEVLSTNDILTMRKAKGNIITNINYFVLNRGGMF